MNTPARLLQIHGVTVDLIYYVEALPKQGREASVSKFNISPGGGFNAMVAAKRSGLDVTYAGAVGGGPLGGLVLDTLKSEDIDCLQQPDRNRDQGCCTVMIDQSGERTFVAGTGAEGYIGEADLQRIKLSDYGWSLISGYTLYYIGSRQAVTRWLMSDMDIPNLIFDPAPIIGSIPQENLQAVLARAAWVTANAAEAKILTGESNLDRAAHLLAEGRSGGAVVRDSDRGCFIAWDGQMRRVKAHNVKPIDTNGAGDAHVGSFIASLARGLSPAESAHYANVTAALSTTHYGPAAAPSLAKIEEAIGPERPV